MTKQSANALLVELKLAEFNYRLFVIFFVVALSALSYCHLAFNFRHTYQLPIDSPGVLVSDRWTFNFVREWLFFLYLLMFISGPFMRLSKTKTGVAVHLVVLVLLLVFGLLIIWADGVDLAQANLPPHDALFDAANLANDPRYCCVWGGQPGTELICANNVTMAACPAIGIEQLRYNSVFVLRFGLNMTVLALLVYDIFVTWLAYLPLLNEYLFAIKSV